MTMAPATVFACCVLYACCACATDTRPRSQATGGSDTLQRVVGVSVASAQPDRRRGRRVTGHCNPALPQSRRTGVSERASERSHSVVLGGIVTLGARCCLPLPPSRLLLRTPLRKPIVALPFFEPFPFIGAAMPWPETLLLRAEEIHFRVPS